MQRQTMTTIRQTRQHRLISKAVKIRAKTYLTVKQYKRGSGPHKTEHTLETGCTIQFRTIKANENLLKWYIVHTKTDVPLNHKEDETGQHPEAFESDDPTLMDRYPTGTYLTYRPQRRLNNVNGVIKEKREENRRNTSLHE